MISPKLDAMFNFPVCFHPTTILSVDDDVAFLEILSAQLSDTLALLCFNEPQKAIDHTKNHHNYLPFRERCFKEGTTEQEQIDLKAIREEIYNKNRFNEVYINVTDYDMPHINGIDLTKTMEFKPEIPRYSHIFLTGKISDDFKRKIHNEDYIGKDDPNYIEHLLAVIEKRALSIFQMYSHEVVRALSRDLKEKPTVLFDGNFTAIFNDYIVNNNICEFYLFDRQGSFMLLDKDTDFSWLFVRNDKGILNSIELAKEFGAPQNVIDALESKKFILSLYEREDFESRNKIDWDKYLLPASEFISNDTYLRFWRDLNEEPAPKYYYAFTKDFPENGIDKDKVLSYNQFLDEQE